MSRFKPYYRAKGADKSAKSTFVSAETSYGSPEHAKWLFERNLELITEQFGDAVIRRLLKVHNCKTSTELLDRLFKKSKKRYVE